MRLAKRIAAVLLLVVACGLTSAGAQTPSSSPTPPQPQSEFVPLDQLPPQEQLPAPRLLIAAYSFVVAALFVYVISVSRRLSAVRHEVERLEADMKRSGRA